MDELVGVTAEDFLRAMNYVPPTDIELQAWHDRIVREEGDKVVPGLDDKEDPLEVAVALLDYALFLRVYGECAPGGRETWRAFDTSVEHFLRRYHGLGED